MNKYINSTIIFLILLFFHLTSSYFTWAQNISVCSDLQNNLPHELATLDSNGLRAVTIQLIDNTPPTEDEILSYSFFQAQFSEHPELLPFYYSNFSRTHYFQFSELYECMIAEERWAPITEKGKVESIWDWISGSLGPTKMTREQLQSLPPEVIPFIWSDLHSTQLSWVTIEQLNYYLSRESQDGIFGGSHNKKYLTKHQIQEINQENVQALNRFDIYRWHRWFSDEQLSWRTPEQSHTLRLDLKQTIIKGPNN